MKVEYTDAPVARPEPTTGDKMPCPYCGHLLPRDAERCDRCDWVRGASETAEGKASDAVAVMFSLVPGLGHIYKGHIFAGILWMIGAIPVGIFVLLAAFASAGWGLGLFSSISPRRCFMSMGSRIVWCRRKRTRARSISRYIVESLHRFHDSRISDHGTRATAA